MRTLGFRLFAAEARRPTLASTSVSTLGALLVGACASYTPQPLVPTDELERLLAVDVGDLRVDCAGPEVSGAREPVRFDPTDGLDEVELVAVSLTINPSLRARRAEIGEAQSLLVTAGLLPNPDLGMFVRPGVGGTPGTSFGLEAMFTLLRPDERPARRAVADARIELVRAEIAAEELRVASQVRRARIAVLSAEESTRLLQQESSVRDETVTLVRQQRELGEATEIALALVELDRTSLRRQVREALSVAERERRKLNAIVGVPPTIALDLVGSGTDLAFTIVPDLTDVELDAHLLAGRAELRARAADYQIAEQELRLAVARQFPGIQLGPSYEKDADGSEGLGLAASIELPLFDRNQGEIAGLLAGRDRLRAAYTAALHDLRARAFEARAELRRTREEIEWMQSDVMPLVQRTESLLASAMRAHETSIFEWLTARTRAIQARRELLDALSRYAGAAVDLDLATGAPLVTVMERTSDGDSPR